ncbi:MAG: NADH:ubiquinone oxidoreductase subunit N, partial [Gammaproteobacteria bacterium]|nr:NADH:ubiquinone oxidoreductase subunit N [Gammaproteobacteria bacterium]
MTLEMLNYAVAWPEIILLGLTCLVLVVDVYLKDEQRNASYFLAQLSLIITLLILLMTESSEKVIAFNGAFVSDALASVLKIFIVAIVAIIFVYSREYLKDRDIFKGEFYVLG